MLFEKSFRCDQQWFSLVTAGEREEYRRRLINLETDEVGEFFQWGTDYEQPWEIGTVSNGKGFLAVARQKADGVVDLLRISVQTDGSVAHTKEIADVSRLLSLENMRGFDEGRLSFSSDGRYLISRLKPGVIDILDIAAKEVKRVPLDSFIARGGWEFPVLKGPYLFLGWDKMIYPLLEHYDFKGTLSRPPWPKARGKRADLLIIDIATAKVERVIPVYGCGGFRNLAIMGSTK